MLVVLVALVAPIPVEAAKKTVAPGDEFVNKSKRPLYLLIVLQPKESFRNTTDKDFQALSIQEIQSADYLFELDFRIRRVMEEERSQKARLSEINGRVDEMNQEWQTLEKTP